MAEEHRVAYQTEVELSTGTILEVKESPEEVELRLRERWASGGTQPDLLTLTRRDGQRVKINAAHVVVIAPREGGVEPVGFHSPLSQQRR